MPDTDPDPTPKTPEEIPALFAAAWMARDAVMVFVAEKRAEGWKVLAAHNTDVIPGAETNGARGGTLTGLDYRG